MCGRRWICRGGMRKRAREAPVDAFCPNLVCRQRVRHSMSAAIKHNSGQSKSRWLELLLEVINSNLNRSFGCVVSMFTFGFPIQVLFS